MVDGMAEESHGVSVVIPAYDEERAVRAEVLSLREVLDGAGIDHEIIVVDDGSTDGTAAEAIAAGARLIQHVGNRGYGASIKSGMQVAHYNRIVITDADGTYPAEALPHLIERLDEADMVVGARVGNEVHIDLLRRPAKALLGILANLIAGQKILDLNSGMRVFYRDTVEQYLPILSDRFSFTTTSTLSLLADNYRIDYQPINYYPRIGRSKIVPRHFMDFVILVLRMSMVFDPLKIFVPLAFACGGLGLLKSLFDVVALFARNPGGGWELLLQPAFSTSAMLLLFTGLQLLLIGMVADGLLRRMTQHNMARIPSRALRYTEHVAEPAPTDNQPAPVTEV